jgi:suppressor of tumorigenicity protein 13
MPPVKLPEKQLTELRAFVTLVRGQPSILHQPDMQFFKQFIESFGGVVPPEDKSEVGATYRVFFWAYSHFA